MMTSNSYDFCSFSVRLYMHWLEIGDRIESMIAWQCPAKYCLQYKAGFYTTRIFG